MTVLRKSIPAFCLFLLAVCGCATAPRITDRMDFHSPEAALKHIAERIPDDVALQAMASIQMTTRGGRYPMKLALLLKKPASLRMEAIPLFGPPAFFLSAHDQTLKVFLTETRAFYIGRATLDNVTRFLPLRMDPEDMIAVLMGTGPPPCKQNTFLQGRTEGEHYRIDTGVRLKRQSLWLRVKDGFLERLEVYQDQGVSYRARFEEPLRVEGSLLPQKTTIVFEGEEGATLTIRFADIRFLKQPDPAIFNLTAPPGIKPVYLD